MRRWVNSVKIDASARDHGCVSRIHPILSGRNLQSLHLYFEVLRIWLPPVRIFWSVSELAKTIQRFSKTNIIIHYSWCACDAYLLSTDVNKSLFETRLSWCVIFKWNEAKSARFLLLIYHHFHVRYWSCNDKLFFYYLRSTCSFPDHSAESSPTIPPNLLPFTLFLLSIR